MEPEPVSVKRTISASDSTSAPITFQRADITLTGSTITTDLWTLTINGVDITPASGSSTVTNVATKLVTAFNLEDDSQLDNLTIGRSGATLTITATGTASFTVEVSVASDGTPNGGATIDNAEPSGQPVVGDLTAQAKVIDWDAATSTETLEVTLGTGAR